MKTLSYCGEYAQENDPQRFFLSLLAPARAHEDLWALLAFNQEIAKTREVVTDTTLGLIRLQWWRDALEKIYAGEVLQHQIVEGLARAIEAHDLPRETFDSLIYAREFDVEDRLPASLEGLVHYADYTTTPLLELCLRVTGHQENVRELAIAYGMTGVLRAVVYHARQRRCYLPEDLMTDISLSGLYDLKRQEKLPGVVRLVAAEAERHLNASRPRSALTRGMKKLVALQLRHMEKCGFDPFNPHWIDPVPFWQLRVALAAKLAM